MNFQNSINQLVGSASYYTSINPSLREAQAERGALRTSLKRAERADKAVSAFEESQIHPLTEEHVSKLPIKRETVQENYAGANAFLNVGGEALRTREAAMGQLFNQQPSREHLDDYMGAQRARMEFEKSASQTIKTRNEFMQFWQDLEDVIGPVRSNVAYKYFDESTPVGGAK